MSFLMERCLTATGERATFLVRSGGSAGSHALLETITADAPEAAGQLRSWELASAISHPNVLRVMETGRDFIEGKPVFYAVMEYPEESLADAAAERTLTAEETAQVAASLRAALDCLHQRGLVHGAVTAPAVVAAGDTIKLVPGRLAEGGDAAGDRRALSILLCRLFTGSAPTLDRGGQPRLEGIPEELAAAIRECFPERPKAPPPSPPPPAAAPPLARQPIAAAPPSAPAPPRTGYKWAYVVIALGVPVLALLMARQPRATRQEPAPPAAPAAPQHTSQAAPPAAKAKPAPPPAPAAAGRWRVIAYTYEGRTAAEHRARTINQKHAGLHAAVFAPNGEDGPYLVSLGGRMPQDEALKLQRKARALGLPRDTYARPFVR